MQLRSQVQFENNPPWTNEDPVGQHSIEAGAFHAMERGILTVAAAGNFGNSSGTVANSMPWMLSAAGSSIDRRLSFFPYHLFHRKPGANILKSEVIDDWEAPVVAIFSSRGPNTKIPEILKPDISALGVAVLAAYSPVGSPSGDLYDDKRSVKYSILSGTSMACPHVAGAAAYVKSLHPKWSGSAIQSSLMTTAWRMDASKNPDTEFAYGSGHLNPLKAVNPGLVYETSIKDNLRLLCSIGYSNSKLRIISGDNSTSCAAADTFTPKDLNYPAMAINITKNKPFTVSFPRTVTNVSLTNTTYKAQIFTDSPLTIAVKPSILHFMRLNEKKSFVLVVTGKGFQQNTRQSASLVWSDSIHRVHSPIVIHTFSFPQA